MDYRSLELNYEINSYIYNEEIAKENKAIFLRDLAQCKEITIGQWNSRPWHQKLIQSVVRLFAPLL